MSTVVNPMSASTVPDPNLPDSNLPDSKLSNSKLSQTKLSQTKPPQVVLPQLWAFAPNRDTLGGTAYYLDHPLGGILIDCPAFNGVNQAFFKAPLDPEGTDSAPHGTDLNINPEGINRPVKYCVITHRGGIGAAAQWQAFLHCTVYIQEQEAYLLPQVPTQTFRETCPLAPDFWGIWVPGHSPGASVWYWQAQGGILFTGRHLLPDASGKPTPLYTRKTFHWPRQVRNVRKLQQEFSDQTLAYLCPGANLGLLRGAKVIERPYSLLRALDLEALSRCQPSDLP